MNTRKLSIFAAAVALVLAVPAAFAQPSSSPSRPDVKSATRDAAQAGTLTPAGEGPGTMGSTRAGTAPGAAEARPARAPSNKSRADVKDAAKAATGTRATAAGQQPLPQDARTERPPGSTTTRAERKSETRRATQAGEIRGGEAPRPLSVPAKQ